MRERSLKFKLCLIGMAFLPNYSCNKFTQPKLESDQSKASYSIGRQIGKSLKGQEIDADIAALKLGLEHEMAGTASPIDEEKLMNAMQAVQQAAAERKSKVAEENSAAAKTFLDENGKKPGIKTTASGLQYEVITEGTGETPTDKSTVKVHYKGTLPDGKEFDSSYKRDRPAEFPLNAVIKGWTEGLQLMKVGSKYKLFVPPELGYGPRGTPDIPGNSALIFEVELLEIIKK